MALGERERMTVRYTADYFDGLSSRPRPVRVVAGDEQLEIEGEDIDLAYPLSQIRVAPPAGHARGIVQLPGGAELHGGDHAALMKLSRHSPSNRPERWARFLESRLRYALPALLLAVLILFAGLRWGVPLVAEATAAVIPAGLENRLGRESLAVMDRLYFSSSALPTARRQDLSRQLAQHCQKRPCPTYRLHFRNSTAIGANAFALPGGEIIVTDQLVRLARHDEEVLAVIAHELGHIERRHGLRLALQSLGAGVLLVAITGDIANFSDMAAGLPSLLLQSGYARDMEREADVFALAWLNNACIPGKRFADLLQRIDHGAKGKGDIDLLSSHPDSAARIQPFLEMRGCG